MLIDELRALVNDFRRESYPKREWGTVGFSWVLAYEYEIETNIVDHRMFLRHLAAHRAEIGDAKEHVARILN